MNKFQVCILLYVNLVESLSHFGNYKIICDSNIQGSAFSNSSHNLGKSCLTSTGLDSLRKVSNYT